MCAISGSFETSMLRELVSLNKYRGTLSHSIMYYNTVSNSISQMFRFKGDINVDDINIPTNCYGVIHTQAPTTNGSDTIHPAAIKTDIDLWYYLWHNGIIKEKDVTRLQKELGMPDEPWDTRLILQNYIVNNTFDNIEGSFSCVMAEPCDNTYNILIFRNEISPMFIDDNLNISSTKFTNSISTEANTIFKLNFQNKHIEKVGVFTTKECPYFYGE